VKIDKGALQFADEFINGNCVIFPTLYPQKKNAVQKINTFLWDYDYLIGGIIKYILKVKPTKR
jgi:hypothetical protein